MPTLTPMRIPEVRRLIMTRVISGAGSWIQIAAAGWFVLEKTGSATSVGILAGLTFAPAVFGGPLGGYLADRYRLGPFLVACNIAQAVPVFVIAFLIWDDEIPITLLYLLVFLSAVPGSLKTTAGSKIVTAAAPRELRAAVLADNAVGYNVSRLTGPLIGSALVAIVGPGGAFFVNGLSFIVNALVISKVKLKYLAEVVRPADAPSSGYLRDIRRGLAITTARVAVVGGLLFFGLVAPIQQLMPTLARTHGPSPFFLGVLLACIAVGGIAANPVIRRILKNDRRSPALVDIGLIATGPMIFLIGLSDDLHLDMIFLIVLGMGWEAIWVAAQTSIQLGIPREINGRILGLFYGAVTLGTAAGSIAIGMLIDKLNTRDSLVLVGLGVCTFGAVSLVRLRRRDDSNPIGATPSRPDDNDPDDSDRRDAAKDDSG